MAKKTDLNVDNTEAKKREKKSLIKNPEAQPKSECQKIRSVKVTSRDSESKLPLHDENV